ncbi:hypothetical protein [Caldisalinibacter kiritimatiensis]|uniref:hypothetical protein n=1 Tax=Caldisalinibacter kiritimatiensis TaxID=1304284 RepID=UPI0004AF6603|nr:hypothetical protein [Caldisalinibacter kiritimatiensis]
MKGYLVLEDGTIFNGELNGQAQNVLGKFQLNSDSITLHCSLTSNSKLITCNSERNNEGLTISNQDFKFLKKKLQDNNKIQGKIVTDSLPIEYHVYDLKTYIPV